MLQKNIKKITEGVYPFHMPGHKRNPLWLEGLLDADITEISGADDLHAPSGIIAEAQNSAASLFGAISTIFLTGGSTCGILAAISAVTKKNDSIIIARNCHKAVYNACLVNGLDVSYIYPAKKVRLGVFGEVSPLEVDTAMKSSGAKVVVITSPTYEGIVSDIKSISATVHKNGGILIVDSAHGAHLGLSDYFPKSARKLGADIVIESAHKTLPCLTGAALLHICSHRINYSNIREKLGIFETSSPSYPILCSIDRAVREIKRSDLFTPYIANLERLYSKRFKVLSLFESGDFDRSKIVISLENADITGFELKKLLLERYKIELEMALPSYALAMTSLADTTEGFDRLIFALEEIDNSLVKKAKTPLLFPPAPEKVFGLDYEGEDEFIKTEKAVGKVSAEFIYAYPPGSPIIAVGERFSEDVLAYLNQLYSSGAQILSSKGNYPDFVTVFKEND